MCVHICCDVNIDSRFYFDEMSLIAIYDRRTRVFRWVCDGELFNVLLMDINTVKHTYADMLELAFSKSKAWAPFHKKILRAILIENIYQEQKCAAQKS